MIPKTPINDDLNSEPNKDVGNQLKELVSQQGAVYHVDTAKCGGMGDVYICSMIIDGIKSDVKVALKTFKDEIYFNPTCQIAFQNEVSLWIRLSDQPYIFPLSGIEIIKGKPYILMPAVREDERGCVSVGDLVRKHSNGLPTKEAFRLIFSSALGMKHAIEKFPGITHGDLKPDNLLLINGYAFISDFGLAKVPQAFGSVPTLLGTKEYLAPECWTKQATATPASDVYAFGCILFALLTGKVPFAGDDETLQLLHIEVEPEFPAFPQNDPMRTELRNIVQSCLSKLPEDRPTNLAEVSKVLLHVGEQWDRETTFEVLEVAANIASINISSGISYKAERIKGLLAIDNPGQALELLSEIPDEDLIDEHLSLAGTVNSLAGNDEKALEYFDRYLKTDLSVDKQVSCLNEVGLSLRRLGRIDKAKVLYEKLLVKSPTAILPAIVNNYAVVLMDAGKPDEAIKYLQPLVAKHSDVAVIWSTLAHAQHADGKPEDAVNSFQRAIALDPNNGTLRVELAEVLMDALGAFEDALVSLDLAYNQGYSSHEWLIRTIAVNMLLGKNEDAAGLLHLIKEQFSREIADRLCGEIFHEAFALVIKLLKKFAQDISLDPVLVKFVESEHFCDSEKASPFSPIANPETDSISLLNSTDEKNSVDEEFPTPFLNARMSMIDGTCALDFYHNIHSSDYPDAFQESYRQWARNLPSIDNKMILRTAGFIFTKCPNCSYVILTNRSPGEQLRCRFCGERNTIEIFQRQDLNGLIQQCENAIERKKDNSSGLVVLLAFWPSGKAQATAIRSACQTAGYELVAEKSNAPTYFLMEVRKSGYHQITEKPGQVWKRVLDEDEQVYEEETPPSVINLLQDLRRKTGATTSMSISLHPGLMLDFLTEDTENIFQVVGKILGNYPTEPNSLRALINMNLQYGRILEAQSLQQLAMQIAPDHPDTCASEAAVYLAVGNPEKAKAPLEYTLQKAPLDQAARLMLIEVYNQLGMNKKADEVMKELYALGIPF